MKTILRSVITKLLLLSIVLSTFNLGGISMINANAAGNYTAKSDVLKSMGDYEKYTMANAGVVVDEDNIAKSVYNKGNQTMIANVIKKAMDGQKITIVGFGGSITQGSAYSTAPNGITHSYNDIKHYVNLVGDWFKDMFKSYGTQVNVVNAGIGATDTVFGIHRMNDDVMAHNPDLVILEWDMNDSNNNTAKQATYENMVRKFLQKGVAVVMLGMCGSNTAISSQPMHEPIAKHYDVPYISYKDAFVNEDYFAKLTNDTVHPNIVGHHLTGLILNSYFADIYKNIATISTEKYQVPTVPYNSEATIYAEGAMVKLSDVADGKVKGVKMVSAGSFKRDTSAYKHGGREYYVYKANYAGFYLPMVLEIENVNTLFFMVMRSYGIVDGNFKIKIDGKEITSETFSSSNSGKHDNSQIERKFLWASARAFYSITKKNIKLEIIPINETKEEYVGIAGLFLTGDFKTTSNNSNNTGNSGNTNNNTTGNATGNNTTGNATGNNTTGNATGNNTTGNSTGNSNGSNKNNNTSNKNNNSGSGNTAKPSDSNSKTDTVSDGSEIDRIDGNQTVEVEEIVEKKESFFSRNKVLSIVILVIAAVGAIAAIALSIFFSNKKKNASVE